MMMRMLSKSFLSHTIVAVVVVFLLGLTHNHYYHTTTSALSLQQQQQQQRQTTTTTTKVATTTTHHHTTATSRRDVVFVVGSLLGLSSLPIKVQAEEEDQESQSQTTTQKTDNISSLLGTYTDPINHPGGYRKIELTGVGFGGYKLAKVIGGGGKGEPASYELPAMIFDCPGNRQGLNRASSSGKLCITIDFTPKGGPKDFTGYYDPQENGIRFILDNNFWPKQ